MAAITAKQKRTDLLFKVARQIRRRYSIRRNLLAWGQEFYQSFKWRDANNKFHGLIAEVLLQRTTAKAAHRVYEAFVTRFPSVQSLAKSTPEQVLEIIRPLGIYSRANTLVEMARILVDEHSADVPQDFDVLLSLPGVGRYAASAFLCLHANQAVAIADSNVQRAASRLIGQKVTVDEAADFFAMILPPKDARRFTLAFLDFSMQICRPNPWQPLCRECPFLSICKTGSKIIAGNKPSWM
ncbi:MAG: hypothetical protein Q8922_04155 [Bacteroidota bacterium]|nr:hypothetical protein [Bacteroidota bacterium]MDP4231773.1 hypothetical protein [Bacteroidota bacterium]MDP4243509.1 hypothetical protein [Bacteroidota bacterium]MDP4287110.1 hypothetical protein [Bacteroidota bacterium]